MSSTMGAGHHLVHGHGLAKHIDVTMLLRQAVGEGLPLVAAGAAAVNAELAVRRDVLPDSRGRRRRS